MDDADKLEIRNLRKALDAISWGYAVKGEDDRYIVVANPDGDAEAIALRGAEPNICVDMETLLPALDRLIFLASKHH